MESGRESLQAFLVAVWALTPLLFVVAWLISGLRRLRDMEVVDALTSDYQGSTLSKVCQLKDERNALRRRVADLEDALAKTKEIPY